MCSDKAQSKAIQDSVLSLTASQKAQRFALRVLCTLFPFIGVRVALYHFTKVRKRGAYSLTDLPKSAETKKLPYRKGHLVTHSWGEGDKVVYLVHGWESNAGRMKDFVIPLVENGFRVIAFDMPAHGHSSQQATHLKDFSTALEAVISHYGKPFGILAHSFGGTATVLLLCEKKDLLPEKLCLISPMKSLESHLNVFNTIAGLPDSIMGRLLNKLKKRYALDSDTTDITRLIQRVPKPGLLIHDEHDSLIPIEVGQALANSWDGVRFIQTYELGHRKILRDATVIQEVASYISEGVAP
jgi:pimeloyl-ACP methyl ester carboxylesterase